MDELRRAFRACRRAPGFAVAAILLIALGVGANTAVFSIVRAVLLRPLPYDDPDRLVFVWRERTDRPVTHTRHGILTGHDVRALGAEARSLSDVAVLRSWQGNPEAWIDLVGDPAPERLRGMYATTNLFALLGVQAARGRTFAADDEEQPVALVSDGLWRRRFAADPSIVGRPLPLIIGRAHRAARICTIIGVLPPGFRFTYPDETEVWLVLPRKEIDPKSAALEFEVIGRLKPGVSRAAAQDEFTRIARAAVLALPIPSAWRADVAKRTLALTETLPQAYTEADDPKRLVESIAISTSPRISRRTAELRTPWRSCSM